MKRLKDPVFIIPFITVAIFVVPISSGMFTVLMGALGKSLPVALPDALQNQLPLWAFFDEPHILNNIIFTLFIGFTTTLLAWSINCQFIALAHGNRLFQWCQRFLSPILATPHITLAVGLIFLLAPSGIIARFLAVPFGWDEPPFWQTNPDPHGFVLILGLLIKELPFLFLLSLSALERINFRQTIRQAQTFGYPSAIGFWKLIYPQLYAQMRLPIFVVLAFSLAIVDMALILAPHAPTLLGVKILQWARDPNLYRQYFAAAGSIWMFVITIGSIALWYIVGELCALPNRYFICNGWRGMRLENRIKPIKIFISGLIFMLIALSIGSIVMLMIWSVSGLWSFPNFIPDNVSLKYWMRALRLMHNALPLTLLIAITATCISLVLVIGCLEAEKRYGFRPKKIGIWILYLPLLIPQISFLFGVQILLLKLNLTGALAVVIFGHVIFVLPYIYLCLAGPWHKLNNQFRLIAYSIGQSPNQSLFKIILPLQLSPLLTAFSLGVSVSIALYLPTYLLGGGNFITLTTEAIVLSSGGNRRIVSVYGLVQASLPLIFFSIAIFLPRLLYKNRKDMDVRT